MPFSSDAQRRAVMAQYGAQQQQGGGRPPPMGGRAPMKRKPSVAQAKQYKKQRRFHASVKVGAGSAVGALAGAAVGGFGGSIIGTLAGGAIATRQMRKNRQARADNKMINQDYKKKALAGGYGPEHQKTAQSSSQRVVGGARETPEQRQARHHQLGQTVLHGSKASRKPKIKKDAALRKAVLKHDPYARRKYT